MKVGQVGKRTLKHAQAIAHIAQIVGRVHRIDRDSKINQRTDLDQVWETLYAIKADAQEALKALRP